MSRPRRLPLLLTGGLILAQTGGSPMCRAFSFQLSAFSFQLSGPEFPPVKDERPSRSFGEGQHTRRPLTMLMADCR